jgi:ubiquinone/menaquinone biosynthesis C-methylase UbiE
MSLYLLMRILESAPRRYDAGIRLLTLGRLDKAYDRLAGYVGPGQQVLDLGCGTGALTLRAAKRGACVKGIDINPQMLEIARQRVTREGLTGNVELVEMGVAELDGEEANHYDVVMSGLFLSELNEREAAYTIREAVRILRPGGLLLIADEIRPRGLLKRVIRILIRAPLAALVYAVTQQKAGAALGLPEMLKYAGLSVVSVRLSLLGDFGEFVARKSATISP